MIRNVMERVRTLTLSTRESFARRVRMSDNAFLLTLAVVVGLVCGACIWIFHLGIELFHELFAVYLTEDVLHPVFGSVSVVISLALAGWFVGKIMDRFVGPERHHGVAGVIEAVNLAGGRLRYRVMPFKATASALSLGAGASVGPEDPSVQIGSNLGSWIGQRLHLSEERVRLLVAAGAAGAIAAAFRAPIAGVFFALEVILNGSMGTSAVGVVVLTAVVTSAFIQGVEAPVDLIRPEYTLGGPLEITLFVPLGLLLAPVAAGFVRLVYWQHDVWHAHIHLARPYRTALAGALVGMVAIFLPEIMGPGRETMNEVLTGEGGFLIGTLFLLAGFKVLMTSVSMAGGFVGGIFAPSLFVGTMLGSIYGRLISDALPGSLNDPQVYAVAGMAGMMAGVVRSPITAIMMVFELTNDYRLILPIMLTTVMCVFLAELLQTQGIYMMSLIRKGIHLQPGREIDVMQGVAVGEAMISPAPVISEKASLLDLRDALRTHKTLSVCVVDDEGLLSGIVTLSDLQRAYDAWAQAGENDAHSQVVGDICARDVVTACSDDVLWTAIRTMSQRDVGRLPVVKRGTREVVGLIGRHGVVRAYNIAIARKMEDQHTAERVRLNALTGAHVFEVYIAPNAPVAGKHIREVHWPAESVVASVQRKGKLILPHGGTELKAGDLLTVVADPAAAPELEKLAGRNPVSTLA